jgi:hypothetical protein
MHKLPAIGPELQEVFASKDQWNFMEMAINMNPKNGMIFRLRIPQ